MRRKFSDYVVYVDESGDHSLTSINPDYPIFVLVFCIFEIDSYIHETVPAVQRLKFKWFGHDTVIFHERELRKRQPPFAFADLSGTPELFLEELTTLVAESHFEIVACVIDKRAYLATGYRNENPYSIGLRFGLERVFRLLDDVNQTRRITHVIVESRGAKEDADLAETFDRTLQGLEIKSLGNTFRLRFVPKSINSTGLQLADMIARPVGISQLRPNQENRAWKAIQSKFWRSQRERSEATGLYLVPEKHQAPDCSEAGSRLGMPDPLEVRLASKSDNLNEEGQDPVDD